ncbi:tetratricopeptide repeat protein [Campylobacter showae]|uniref:tetratricopeptide repeat protein n=1 Tax=Campylobacter showae TaxID=204 RepID=UPI003C6EB1BF
MAVGADINALKKECDDGNGASCYELGVLYDNARNGAAQDYQKAAELYSKTCELGNGGGCYNLGNLYAQGRGVKKDTNAAKITSKKRAIWSRS